MGKYIPPTVEVGSDCPFEHPEIGPGVRGYAVKHGQETWIPWLEASKEGSGDVGRFLDSLDSSCRVVNVISPRLAGMLKRRGWKAEAVKVDDDGAVDVWRCVGFSTPTKVEEGR